MQGSDAQEELEHHNARFQELRGTVREDQSHTYREEWWSEFTVSRSPKITEDILCQNLAQEFVPGFSRL